METLDAPHIKLLFNKVRNLLYATARLENAVYDLPFELCDEPHSEKLSGNILLHNGNSNEPAFPFNPLPQQTLNDLFKLWPNKTDFNLPNEVTNFGFCEWTFAVADVCRLLTNVRDKLIKERKNQSDNNSTSNSTSNASNAEPDWTACAGYAIYQPIFSGEWLGLEMRDRRPHWEAKAFLIIASHYAGCIIDTWCSDEVEAKLNNKTVLRSELLVLLSLFNAEIKRALEKPEPEQSLPTTVLLLSFTHTHVRVLQARFTPQYKLCIYIRTIFDHEPREEDRNRAFHTLLAWSMFVSVGNTDTPMGIDAGASMDAGTGAADAEAD